MGYSSSILKWHVAILKKKDAGEKAFGETTEYETVACVHANVTWKKGQKSLNEGALDSIDTVLIRMRSSLANVCWSARALGIRFRASMPTVRTTPSRSPQRKS